MPELIADTLRLPAGVRLVRTGYDPDRDVITVLLTGDAFPETAEGDVIPYVEPLVHCNADGTEWVEWPYYTPADSYGVPA